MTEILKGTLHPIPEDMFKSLTSDEVLVSLWNSLTPLARNEWICYVTIVKKAETRAGHIERLRADILAGKKRPCCWPGCPHHRPSAGKYFKTKKETE
jgi:uncharacterized protein YdeI (YjbR/CyaY-like superfamily)